MSLLFRNVYLCVQQAPFPMFICHVFMDLIRTMLTPRLFCRVLAKSSIDFLSTREVLHTSFDSYTCSA